MRARTFTVILALEIGLSLSQFVALSLSTLPESRSLWWKRVPAALTYAFQSALLCLAFAAVVAQLGGNLFLYLAVSRASREQLAQLLRRRIN